MFNITFPPTPRIPKLFLCLRVSYENLYSFSFSSVLVTLLTRSNKIYLTQQVDDEGRKAYSSQSEAILNETVDTASRVLAV